MLWFFYRHLVQSHSQEKIERLIAYKLLEKFKFLNIVAERRSYSFLEVEREDSFGVN